MNEELSDEYKVWIDYMVEMAALNCKLAYYWKDFSKFYIKPFDEFCAMDNVLKSECLSGWRWRFEDRIFKSTDSMQQTFKNNKT